MNDIQKSTHSHPTMQLVYLLLFCVIGGFVFSTIGLIIYGVFFGTGGFMQLLSSGGNIMDVNFLRIVQISSSLGIFIAGPIAYAQVEKYKPAHYYHFNRSFDISLIFAVFAIMLLGAPLLELIASLNQKMVLPDFLKGLELWMKEKEEQAAVLTKQLLVMRTYADLTINLLMIAVIPAVGEELLFRGGVQNIFTRWFGNPHTAIWITAIIFSVIHIQFFGFFPRLLLGALFGYLLLWGKNIWLPIFAHFMNNGTAVLMAFIMQRQGKSLDEIEKTESFEYWGYLLSAIITLILLIAYYKQSKKNLSNSIYE
ncbi:MAG: CPBP family intramembrane metalloprotease [Pedobacter sp.]|nr:MAG: CPBP family intramembrane metalloprotease [Pedobacter sp.]